MAKLRFIVCAASDASKKKKTSLADEIFKASNFFLLKKEKRILVKSQELTFETATWDCTSCSPPPLRELINSQASVRKKGNKLNNSSFFFLFANWANKNNNKIKVTHTKYISKIFNCHYLFLFVRHKKKTFKKRGTLIIACLSLHCVRAPETWHGNYPLGGGCSCLGLPLLKATGTRYIRLLIKTQPALDFGYYIVFYSKIIFKNKKNVYQLFIYCLKLIIINRIPNGLYI